MKRKVLVICGATATGKTKLALELARKFNGEIISADSRQVYRGMDIGTGKDIPIETKIKIWGIDLVNPDEEFSVSQYREYARSAIGNIVQRKKLPIVVGGTGFYIDSIFDNKDKLDVPKNEKLRKYLQDKSVSELFEMLRVLNKKLAKSLNNSDKNNKVRLIRKIEISLADDIKPQKSEINYDVIFIGLRLDKQKLSNRIKKRVEDRIKQGFKNEYKKLKKEYGDLSLFEKTPGYKDWLASPSRSGPDTDSWAKDEINYAKRQMTWFKKNLKINWFNADDSKLVFKVEERIKRWYPEKENA